MSGKKPDGGPAYPVPPTSDGREGCSPHPYHTLDGGYGGMSLRDYFAGQVLAGVNVWEADKHSPAIAIRAYMIADAMLEARER